MLFYLTDNFSEKLIIAQRTAEQIKSEYHDMQIGESRPVPGTEYRDGIPVREIVRAK
jgi:hypothetical protein